jgi:quinol monooxygenase YgiN
MIEKWASVEAWQQHMETEHVKHIQVVTPTVTAKETVLRFLHPVTQTVQS